MKLRLLKSVLTLLAMMPAMTDVWSVAVTWRLLGGRGDHYQLVLHTTQTLSRLIWRSKENISYPSQTTVI